MTKRFLSEEQLNNIWNDLQGSCQSLENVLEYYEIDPSDLTQADYEDLDNLGFNCHQCGWWFEAGDWAEGDDTDGIICTDCGKDNEDE